MKCWNPGIGGVPTPDEARVLLPSAPHLSGALAPALFLSLVLLGLLHAASVGAQEGASPPGTVLEAFAQGTPRLDLRYRFEFVADDAVELDAYASTMRTALGYQSARFRGLDLLLEAENTSNLLAADKHRNAGAGDLSNDVTDRPVVADPPITRMNQAYLRFTGDGASLIGGRQEISLGDHRLVGNVGWRQNHQSFDAVRLQVRSIPHLNLSYAFLDQVHRIFGDSKQMSSHSAQIGVALGRIGTLTPYLLYLDYDNDRDFALSTSTLGVEFKGSHNISDALTLEYEGEYARQREAADNPAEIDADYVHLMGALKAGSITFRGGWESLGGSEDSGQFNTPLATLHMFNGWADKFLTTPTDGLTDLYVGVAGGWKNVRVAGVYHDFGADAGSDRFGSEFDFELSYRSPWEQVFAAKGAFYAADEYSTDTTKLMIWTAYGI